MSQDKMDIPAWMFEESINNIGTKKSAKANFLTKTIKELSSIIQNEIFSERFVNYRGYLQLIDPRIKLLTLLFYMLFCSVTKSLITLILLALISIGFVKFSKLNIKDYLKRVWLIIPLIVFVMSIPAATSLFVKGTPLLYIYKSESLNLYFSFTGLQTILKMAVRIGTSISFAYLLIMTTKWSHITKSLSIFKVPLLIITIFNMTYRYIFMLSKIATEMIEARYLRTVGSSDNRSNRTFIANRMSFLFIKASYFSDEIYDAMRCRGFSGESVSLYKFKIKNIDYMWLFNNVVILIVLFLGELIH